MEMLRPLAEGLACFAELDSIPGKSDVITQPMLSAFFNFGGVEHELRSQVTAEEDINLFLFNLLYRARMSPDRAAPRERPCWTLSLEDGGHLAGYMSVKNIRTRAWGESELAGDPELFSMFLRSFIYDDYGLIAHLLDFSLAEHAAANAIATYLHQRLKQLLILDWDANLAEFEKHFATHGDERPHARAATHPRPGGIGSDPALAASGKIVSESWSPR